VDVRHRERVPLDPGQRRDVRELHERRVARDAVEERPVGEQHPGNAHPGDLRRRDLVGELVACDERRDLRRRHGGAPTGPAIK